MSTFKELLKTIGGDSQLYAKEMSLYPCGVWSDTVKLRANNGMELNSHISDTGDDIIQCVAIAPEILLQKTNLIWLFRSIMN